MEFEPSNCNIYGIKNFSLKTVSIWFEILFKIQTAMEIPRGIWVYEERSVAGLLIMNKEGLVGDVNHRMTENI